MKIAHFMLVIPLIFASCSIYRQQFDCPPDPGVPCTSVSDLEQMIVETQEGPDLFLGINPEQWQIHAAPPSNRIWISNQNGGVCYIYLQQEKPCWIH